MKPKFSSFLPYIIVAVVLSAIKIKTDYKPENSEEFRKFTESIHKDFEKDINQKFTN